MQTFQSQLIALVAATLYSVAASALPWNIPAQPLPLALEELARQGNLQVLYVPEQIRALRSTSVHCECSVEAALTELLQGLGQEFIIRDNTVVVRPRQKKDVAAAKAARAKYKVSWVNSIEEILVTAQKREQRAQDVPIAVDVVDGATLQALGVQNGDDMESMFPNLTTNDTSNINTGLTIRGVGTNNYHISGQQSVGLNIDDVATVSPFISAIAIYDKERMEVLRGPQNTLYGRNTTAGVINFHTRKARVEDGTNGNALLKVGNGGLQSFEGAFGFPIKDNLAARIALMHSSFDGTWTNLVDGSDFGATDNQGARLNLLWEISDRTSMSLTTASTEGSGDTGIQRQVGNLSRDGISACPTFARGEPAWISGVNNCWTLISSEMIASNDYLAQQQARGNTDLLIPNPNFIGNGGSEPLFDYLVNYSSRWGQTYQHPAAGYKADFDNIRFKLLHDFGAMQLTWLSAYDQLKVRNISTYGLAGFAAVQQGDWEVQQHEMRLASSGNGNIQWLLGLYHNTQDSIEDTWILRGELAESPAITIDSQYHAWSAYGQVDFNLNRNWSLTTGMRYTNDTLAGHSFKTLCTSAHGVTTDLGNITNYDRQFRNTAGCDVLPLIDNTPTQKLSETGWKIGLKRKLGTDAMIYSSVSKGFKGGSYDNRTQASGDQPIAPEYLIAYELGLKSSLFNHTLQFNAATYWYNWEDLQIFATAPDSRPLQLNIPATELRGLELSSHWTPSELFYLQAGLAFSHNTIKELTALQESALFWKEGYEVTNAPDLSANLTMVNRFPLDLGTLVFQTSYRYMSDYFFYTSSANDARAQARDHHWLNGRITYQFGGNPQYSIALWGNNLTNEKSLARLQPLLPGNINFPGQVLGVGERTWGISFETHFN